MDPAQHSENLTLKLCLLKVNELFNPPDIVGTCFAMNIGNL